MDLLQSDRLGVGPPVLAGTLLELVAPLLKLSRVGRQRGEPIPEGWALDAEGNPTTDAEAALARRRPGAFAGRAGW